MNVRLLESRDIPAAVELSREAGWNQTEADWRRLLALEPEGCFALDSDGRLAGTTTAICFGLEMAWIGMVLTHLQFRRRGIARRLMEHALEFTHLRGIPVVRLDATAMGRPLYADLGFEDECAVERWLRPAGPHEIASAPAPYHPIGGLDRLAFGCDRTGLLRSLAEHEAASVPGLGYAMGRPGTRATYFGPCVARTAETARLLVEWFLARHANEPAFWDLLPENRAALTLAAEFGFMRDRAVVRMVRRERPEAVAPPLDTKLTFAIAGFEYG